MTAELEKLYRMKKIFKNFKILKLFQNLNNACVRRDFAIFFAPYQN